MFANTVTLLPKTPSNICAHMIAVKFIPSVTKIGPVKPIVMSVHYDCYEEQKKDIYNCIMLF